ncbi:hypothetical protein OHB00_02840 [Streptomyces sp. NBC_00631]|uniref:hypothetical protein n=1 Tax=Streptomyces sp. NBC_00631 TaxID=2975793 RepID=UPI0030E06549
MKTAPLGHRNRQTIRSAMVVAAFVAAGTAALSMPSAQAVTGSAQVTPASAAQCEGGANGFVDISDSLSGTIPGPAGSYKRYGQTGHVRITLEYGTVSGAQRGWAKIDGGTFPGDRVWMDRTQDGGSTWLQCGPFTVGSNGASKTSAAKNTSGSSLWRFRACGDFTGESGYVCTNWW